jgi:hypothetical protein
MTSVAHSFHLCYCLLKNNNIYIAYELRVMVSWIADNFCCCMSKITAIQTIFLWGKLLQQCSLLPWVNHMHKNFTMMLMQPFVNDHEMFLYSITMWIIRLCSIVVPSHSCDNMWAAARKGIQGGLPQHMC